MGGTVFRRNVTYIIFVCFWKRGKSESDVIPALKMLLLD